jgi:hypothetical protein
MSRPWVVAAVAVFCGGLLWWALSGTGQSSYVPSDGTAAVSAHAPPVASTPEQTVNSNELQAASIGTVSEASSSGARYSFATLKASSDINELYRSALKMMDEDTVAVAMSVASSCLFLPKQPLSTEELVGLHGMPIERAKLVSSKLNAAQLEFNSFCKGGDSNRFLDELSQAVRKNQSGGKITSLASPILGLNRERNPAGYDQAMTTVLGNPPAYTAAFDLWLDKRMPSLLPASFTREQVSMVQDTLFLKLVGETQGNSLRGLVRCLSSNSVCGVDTQVSEADTAAAKQAAEGIEQAIRQQRWHVLRSNP